MRRVLAILLLCVFGVPMALPLFAATADQDAGLPACCRRNGAHHCSMTGMGPSMPSQGEQLTAQHEKCPVYPAATTAIRHGDASLFPASTLLATLTASPAEQPETLTRGAAAFELTQHERGPPSLRR